MENETQIPVPSEAKDSPKGFTFLRDLTRPEVFCGMHLIIGHYTLSVQIGCGTYSDSGPRITEVDGVSRIANETAEVGVWDNDNPGTLVYLCPYDQVLGYRTTAEVAELMMALATDTLDKFIEKEAEAV